MTGSAPTGTTAMTGVEATGETTVKNGAATKLGAGSVGTVVDLDGFGGSVVTHDNKSVTLQGLVEESKAGVVCDAVLFGREEIG